MKDDMSGVAVLKMSDEVYIVLVENSGYAPVQMSSSSASSLDTCEASMTRGTLL